MSKLSADTGNDYPSAHAGLQDALDAATTKRVSRGIYCGERKACDPPEIYPNKKGFILPAGVDALVTVRQSSTREEVLRALAVSSYNAGFCASRGYTSPLIPLLIKDALLRADELAAGSNDHGVRKSITDAPKKIMQKMLDVYNAVWDKGRIN